MKYLFSLSVLLFPGLVLAQTRTLDTFFDIVLEVINNMLVPLFVAIAVLYLIWNVYKYYITQSEEDKAEATQKIIYGIIALFIIVSVWGFVNLLVNTFNLENRVPTEDIPRAPLRQPNSVVNPTR